VAEAVVKGLGNVIYTSHDILPNHQCCVFYVSGKIFREQPEMAKKLVKIHLRAMKYIAERPNDAMAIFADRTGKSLDVVQESWKRMIWDYHLNTTSMKTFVSFLIQQDKIQSMDVPSIDEFINNAIDKQFLAEVEINGL
jgi:NitT/TauT family transport system substrate-binding protein